MFVFIIWLYDLKRMQRFNTSSRFFYGASPAASHQSPHQKAAAVGLFGGSVAASHQKPHQMSATKPLPSLAQWYPKVPQTHEASRQAIAPSRFPVWMLGHKVFHHVMKVFHRVVKVSHRVLKVSHRVVKVSHRVVKVSHRVVKVFHRVVKVFHRVVKVFHRVVK